MAARLYPLIIGLWPCPMRLVVLALESTVQVWTGGTLLMERGLVYCPLHLKWSEEQTLVTIRFEVV